MTAHTRGERRARYYDTARTAHLERLARMVPADFLYTRRRADWDEGLARALPEVHRVSASRVAGLILRGRYDVVEIPEPLAVRLIPQLALVAVATRLRNLRRGGRTRLVTYAIENLDPIAKFSAQTRLPRGLSAAVLRASWRVIFADITRIAVGTGGALDTYRAALGRRWPRIAARADVREFPALPSANALPVDKTPGTVCFLGTFEDRKGIIELLDAWPRVVEAVPGARLTVMGKGERERDVRELANALPSVQLDIDPPRDVIRNTLARSVVLVLLSKRTPLWREQVGLPIVEALEQGCEIVTTEETGIASWLAEHGHAVVADAGDAAAVAGAIAARLRGARPLGELLAALPDEDSRIAADAWMFGVTGDPADQERAAVGRAGETAS